MSVRDEKPGLWDLAMPWLVAAMVGGAVPWLILLGEWWITGSLRHRVNDWAPFFLRNGKTLDPATLAYWRVTAACFWLVGLVLSLRRVRVPEGFRAGLAWWILNKATGLLSFSGPMLAVLWALAVRQNRVPPGPWGVAEGNHGPWRWAFSLSYLLFCAFALPLYALVLATASWLAKRYPATPWIAGGSIVVFLGLVWSHFWLVD